MTTMKPYRAGLSYGHHIMRNKMSTTPRFRVKDFNSPESYDSFKRGFAHILLSYPKDSNRNLDHRIPVDLHE